MTITSYDPRAISPVEAAPDNMPAWIALLIPTQELADVLAQTEFVPQALRGRPAAITAAILYGYEVGVGPMQALQGIDVIQGKPTPSAELLRALIYQAGHEMWVVEASGTRVTVGGRRSGQAREHTVTWTSEMARGAGLTGKDSWKKYPRAMLMARATSELARSIFPDAVHGLGSLADTADVAVVDVGTPDEAVATAGTVRRTRKRAAPAQTSDAAPVPTDVTPNAPAPSSSEPPTDNDTEAGAVTAEQLARLNIAFRELDVTDRDHRLGVAMAVIGRRIGSSKDLTVDEASRLITELEDAKSLDIPLPAPTTDP